MYIYHICEQVINIDINFITKNIDINLNLA